MSEKYLHLSLYQLRVSVGIEQRLIDFARPNEEKFKKMWTEYEHRIETLCKIKPDWKDNYTKIMLRAYQGTINKYNKLEE
jgi:hypothetical protein